ncbi:MAG TPA: proteasome activator, partial [Acidimicrobiales bacterium]|nr:proteasome activator [Acidimicrobiales bacterium]
MSSPGPLDGPTDQPPDPPATTDPSVSPDEVLPARSGSRPGEAESGEDGREDQARESIEQPAKVMRIGSMVKQLLDEVRQAPLDEAGRIRLREIYEISVRELATGLSPDLVAELDR